MPDPKPEPESHGTAAQVVNGVKYVGGMTPQQMNNLIVLILALFVGGLIWLDRHDRIEAQAQQLRTYESQNELTRQAVSLVGERVERAGASQTIAIQNLALEVGKLHQTVSSVKKN